MIGEGGLASCESDRTADCLASVQCAPFQRLKRAVSKLGEKESWAVITSALLKLGRLTAEIDPGQARNLARVAISTAGRVDHPEIARRSFLVEAECLAGDSSRRLRRLRAAERSFVRAGRHLAAGCDVGERAYFLVTLSNLREDQERDEEALALRARAARLYGALGEIDSQATVLSSIAALEMSRAETDEAVTTLVDILALIDRGLGGLLALGAAVSFATLKSVSSCGIPEAIALLERVRARYPDLAGSEEMAALHLLEGRILTFGTRPDLAETQLRTAFRWFLKLDLLHDASVASLGLAVLFLYRERGEELRVSVEETIGVLLARVLPEGVREVLSAFREAARAGRATITLAHALMRYFEQSEGNPNLKFIPPVPRPGRGR